MCEYDCIGADLTALIDNPLQKDDRLLVILLIFV
jgi:hypothetical protein